LFSAFQTPRGRVARARLHSRIPPSFHVREAIFMVFNVGIPSAIQSFESREAASKTFK
jgi:hypothetical protein